MDKITRDYCVVSGSYGRDNKTAKDAVADFVKGRDFEMHTPGFGGRFCSIRDFSPGVTVSIRYKAMRNVVNHTIEIK